MRSWHRNNPTTIKDPMARRFGDDVDQALRMQSRAIVALQKGKLASSTGGSAAVAPAAVTQLQTVHSALAGTPSVGLPATHVLGQTGALSTPLLADSGAGGMFLLHLVVVPTAGYGLMQGKLSYSDATGLVSSHWLGDYDLASLTHSVQLDRTGTYAYAYDTWSASIPVYLPSNNDFAGYVTLDLSFTGTGAGFAYDLHCSVTAL